jgi:hypothetical protein
MTLLPRLSPQSKAKLKRRIALGLAELRSSGFWLCLNCEGINTREEREQGLPPHCSTCGGIRFHLEPASIHNVIEPQDLYDKEIFPGAVHQ